MVALPESKSLPSPELPPLPQRIKTEKSKTAIKIFVMVLDFRCTERAPFGK
jgi:hypothetical protein